MSDTITFALLVGAFGVWTTAHVTIAYGLVRRPPRWRAFVALVIPLAGPYFAVSERLYVRAAMWVLGAVVYVVARGRG